MAALTSTSAPESLKGLPGAGARRVVVLDDDRTGTQTVVGVPTVTAWEDEDLRRAPSRGGLGSFVLTSTRSLGAAAAAQRNAEVLPGLRRGVEKVNIISELGVASLEAFAEALPCAREAVALAGARAAAREAVARSAIAAIHSASAEAS